MIDTTNLTATRVTIAALLAVVGGCGQTPAKQATDAQSAVVTTAQTPGGVPGEIMFAGPSAVISDAACTGKKNGTKVLFTVKPNMLKTLGGANQHIERQVDRDVGGVETSEPTPPADIAKRYNRTYLDFGVPAPDGMNTWTEVTIKLKNKNDDGIRFMPVRNAEGVESKTDSSYAVLAEAGRASQFCGRKPFEVDKKDNDIVRFGVKLAKYETVSINIGLLIEDRKNSGYWIPVYLDPNIKNTG
jgi:hypothetical protein